MVNQDSSAGVQRATCGACLGTRELWPWLGELIDFWKKLHHINIFFIKYYFNNPIATDGHFC
jgi:hypothetical protein